MDGRLLIMIVFFIVGVMVLGARDKEAFAHCTQDHSVYVCQNTLR